FGADFLQFGDPRDVVLALGEFEVGERNRIEVVVRQQNEPESEATKLRDLFDHGVSAANAWFLPIGAPDGTEGAMLRTSADGLHRSPHITVARHDVPAGLPKFGAADTTGLIDL